MGEQGEKIKLRSVEKMMCIRLCNQELCQENMIEHRTGYSYFQVQAALELAEEAEGDMEESTMLKEEV